MIHVGIRRRLLRRHVGRGAQRHAQRGETTLTGRGAHRLGHPEVHHHRMVPRQQHVVRLDVAMDHVLPMRIGQRVEHLLEDPHRVPHRQLALAGQLGAERLALDERHDVVEEVALGPGGEQRDDVRVLQLGRELDLAVEPLDVDARAHLGRQHLDHHAPAELDLLRQEHAAHAAAAQFLVEAVGAAQGGLEPGLKISGHDGQLR